MFYQLWDLESGNLVGDFDTEAAALTAVREQLAANASDSAAALALGCAGDDGQQRVIAEGAALTALAQRRDPRPTRRTA